jgi:hypothetical protein
MLYTTAPDALAIAMQYIDGAADDADYGSLLADGSREEGADYNDYLGQPVVYDGQVEQPEARQLGAMDCSGFVRMVWGYRLGLSLAKAESNSASLPRRAVQMYVAGRPGIPRCQHQ